MNDSTILIEIGVGERKIIPGSLGLNIRKTDHVVIIADARYLPFKDERIDLVYSSHIIEHFSHLKTKSILNEWIRVLKPGSPIEIRGPDLIIQALLFFIMPSKQNIKNISCEQNYKGNYHKCGFSYGLLKKMLTTCEIAEIKRIFDGYKGIPFMPFDFHVIGKKAESKYHIKEIK